MTDDRSVRPRYSPVTGSSSQRAPQVVHWQASTRIEATNMRSTSYEEQNGHARWWHAPPAIVLPPACMVTIP